MATAVGDKPRTQDPGGPLALPIAPSPGLPGKFLVLAVLIAGPPLMLHTLWSNPVSAAEDDLIYYYPLRRMVGESLRQGRWPVGNPREAGGSVLLADPQSSLLHPTTWMFAVMEARPAYALSIWCAFWLAGAGAWLYARRLGLRPVAALLAAVVFTYCGFMIGHRVHLSILLCAAMLPWGLWCIETLRGAPTRALAWWVPSAFLAAAAGHWPTMVHVGILWGAYLLLRGRPLVRALGVAALAGGVTALLLGPQLIATAEALHQATRAKMGYAMAGENSFYPAAGLLAAFPFIFGSRTPGFFPQRWWGPWHLCEMLGYVGLVTLVLAGAAVLRLYSRRGGDANQCGVGEPARLRPIVRLWTWIALGAGIWMLGYYLPTYRIIHALPVLGMVRCPARMVLGVNFALAVLAAVTVHVVLSATPPGLVRAIRRGATLVLPLAMVLALVLTRVIAGVVRSLPAGSLEGVGAFAGNARDALAAVSPSNPAVWVPLVLMLLTGLVVWVWVQRPERLAPGLLALVVLDLFIPARFVDVPPASYVAQDPDGSPASEWLKRHAPDLDSYRIWGIGDPYGDRQAELLLAKTCQGMGHWTISNYGPLHSPRHAHLLGFEIFGTNRNWESLLRRNHLLSLYNVRYILVEAGGKEADVLRQATIPEAPPPAPGDDLLSGDWMLSHAAREGEMIRLRTPLLWRPSEAVRPGRIPAGTLVRISLDARAPKGGAADELRADLYRGYEDGTCFQRDSLTLRVSAERMGEDWRRFTWTCETPEDLPAGIGLRIRTRSERPIEVRNATVRESPHGATILLQVSLPPGQPIYRKVAELPALRTEDPPVAIYENRLFGPYPQAPPHHAPPTTEQLEELRFGRFSGNPPSVAPFIGLRSDRTTPGRLLLRFAVAWPLASCLWIAGCQVLRRFDGRTAGVCST